MPEHNVIADLADMLVDIATLSIDPSNARRHPDRNLNAIKASLKLFGQRKPVVVQKDGMIVRAGNGTMAAAKALGWKQIAAVVVDDDNSTATQYAIADNRTSELAEWDDETLGVLLQGMTDKERELLAFDQSEFAKMLEALEPIEESGEPVLGDIKFSIQVYCESETQQGTLLEQLTSEGYECKALMS